MKNTSVKQVVALTGCSKSTAIEIVYSDLHLNRKIYLNRGNNARATINWLEKKFSVNFTKGNDAPRGGKAGDFVTFESNEAFEKFANTLVGLDAASGLENNRIAEQKEKSVNEMVITEEEKEKYLQKVEGLSNKQARKIAYNFSSNKVGFYSTEAMKKFFELSK